jgi:hypothetical protein
MSTPHIDRRLGQILLAKHWITNEQLEEALDVQIVNGGRLGTNLVELSRITEGQLADALQEQHQVKAVHGEIVPHDDALATIRAELCDRHDLLPVRLEKRADGESLYLGVVKPMTPPQLDELSRRLKMFVHQIVLPEFRMNQLLRKYAKAYRPLRQVDLQHAATVIKDEKKKEDAEELMSEEEFQRVYASALSGGRHDSLHDVHAEHHEELAKPKQQHDSLHPELNARTAHPEIDLSHHEDPDHEIHGGQAPAVTTAPRPVAPAAAAGPAPEPVKPLSFIEAQAALTSSKDRTEIAHAVMRYAASKYLRAVLFVMHGDSATGWEGVGRGLEGQAAKRVVVSLASGPFRQVLDSGKHFLGALPSNPIDDAFHKLIGGPPLSAVLVPILVKGKVVNIFYADSGPGRATSPDVAELEVLTGKVGAAYDQLLARRKAELAAQMNQQL